MGLYTSDGLPANDSGLVVQTEHGNISSGYVANTLSTVDTRFRTAFPVEVTPGTTVAVSVLNDASSVSAIKVWEYGAGFSYISSSTVSDGVVTVSTNTHFVKFTVEFGASGYDPKSVRITSGGILRVVKNPKIQSTAEYFVFEVSPGIYTSGALMLPPNYDPDPEAEPVPLLVYIHGSNGYSDWSTTMGALFSGASYLTYIEYLRDEGFAILDVYGWTSKYKATADTQSSGNKSNTFITPITYRAFLTGIRYALSRYNLDPNDVSLYCKSLGGGLANVFATKSDIPVRAICELAPTIDSLFWGGWGQSVQGRTIIADQLGFTGNVESVFLQSNFDWRTTNGKAFIDANIDKIAGFNQGWNYNGKTLAEKLADSYSKTYTRTDYCREVLYPIKIWVAPDDTNISYAKITEFVAQCKNNSEDVTLRLMPENTGGHHSVDSDANAPKSSGTTALGITYTDIPTAYVEMVEFIRSR